MSPQERHFIHQLLLFPYSVLRMHLYIWIILNQIYKQPTEFVFTDWTILKIKWGFDFPFYIYTYFCIDQSLNKSLEYKFSIVKVPIKCNLRQHIQDIWSSMLLRKMCHNFLVVQYDVQCAYNPPYFSFLLIKQFIYRASEHYVFSLCVSDFFWICGVFVWRYSIICLLTFSFNIIHN